MDKFIDVLTEDAGIALGALAIVCVTLVFVVAIVSIQWRSLRRIEELTKLKHSLLDRGLSPEEIALIVEAGGRRGFRHTAAHLHRELARC
ncbi:MAG: hypothetical protein K2Y37_07120 [Pirellulales bacterium]|nr:hypothetical protein [Pirellulales bacterium]